MYRHGWDERNGGNVSLMLEEAEVKEYLDVNNVLRTIPVGFQAPALAGKYFLVTGTGKYFKNVQFDPARNLGLLRITEDGENAQILWGYSDGGKFTSEFPAHMILSRYSAFRLPKVSLVSGRSVAEGVLLLSVITIYDR